MVRLRAEARRWALSGAGLVLGSAAAFAELALLAATGLALLPVLPWPRGRAAVLGRARAAAAALAGWHSRRLERYLGEPAGAYGPPDGDRALRYAAVRWVAGLLGLATLVVLAAGLVVAGSVLLSWAFGLEGAALEDESGRATTQIVAWSIIPGAVLLYLNLTGIAGVATLDRALGRRFLRPSRTEELRRRVDELAQTRAGAVAAVDAERRRIERDLHDGVQQRLVALGMLLGRARRQADSELLRQAHEESQRVLAELREVAWRVYPTALDSLGLGEALAAVAERAGMPVTVGYQVDGPIPKPVETAAYFVVCEAVTNAAKHSGASRITVEVARRGTIVDVRVHDDGKGGADPLGGGLSGLALRVAAIDGRLTVHSPPGGPTVIGAELPCG